MPWKAAPRQPPCADVNGFNLHAAVRARQTTASGSSKLCRYITRPPLSDERVHCNAAGQVVLRLKAPCRDGTTHLVMSPLEFMQRLAAKLRQVQPTSEPHASDWFCPPTSISECLLWVDMRQSLIGHFQPFDPRAMVSQKPT